MSIPQNSQPKIRFTVIPAVYLILKKGDKYLFGKRLNTGYMDGYYQLPAGHLEGLESLKTAMMRETKEEIGLDILASDLNLVFTAHRLVEENVERIDFFFECQNFEESKIKNSEPKKCSELVWLTKDDLGIVPYTKEVLRKLENGNNYLDLNF